MDEIERARSHYLNESQFISSIGWSKFPRGKAFLRSQKKKIKDALANDERVLEGFQDEDEKDFEVEEVNRRFRRQKEADKPI